MTKIYPNATTIGTQRKVAFESPSKPSLDIGNEVVLTVWKKSLLMSCDGFTVFDSKGNLVFRVDNYMRGSKGEIVLMDASGKSLLTIRRKRLSLGDNWLVYEGDTTVNPVYSMTKHVSLLNSKSSLAHVTSIRGGTEKKMMYEIEGSYSQRCCTIYDDQRQQVAEIKRKEAVRGMILGLDVFRLVVVQPNEIESSLAMCLVILLDQMFGSSRRHYPMCVT